MAPKIYRPTKIISTATDSEEAGSGRYRTAGGLLNRRDRYHAWALRVLSEIEPPLLTCEAVISETCFLLGRQSDRGTAVFDLLERGLVSLAFSLDKEASRVRAIMGRYGSVPASLADACLVRMAEVHAGSRVLTLDSDFHLYRIHDRKVIPLISPEG